MDRRPSGSNPPGRVVAVPLIGDERWGDVLKGMEQLKKICEFLSINPDYHMQRRLLRRIADYTRIEYLLGGARPLASGRALLMELRLSNMKRLSRSGDLSAN